MKVSLMRWITLLALLAGAIVFYLSGMLLGVLALFIAGAILEVMFWGKLLLGDRKHR